MLHPPSAPPHSIHRKQKGQKSHLTNSIFLVSLNDPATSR